MKQLEDIENDIEAVVESLERSKGDIDRIRRAVKSEESAKGAVSRVMAQYIEEQVTVPQKGESREGGGYESHDDWEVNDEHTPCKDRGSGATKVVEWDKKGTDMSVNIWLNDMGGETGVGLHIESDDGLIHAHGEEKLDRGIAMAEAMMWTVNHFYEGE